MMLLIERCNKIAVFSRNEVCILKSMSNKHYRSHFQTDDILLIALYMTFCIEKHMITHNVIMELSDFKDVHQNNFYFM